ncbi:MAG: type II secretion system protein GspK [Deltaproteobacteria bacterium]|nr:type II secretion system protein GspK [Deltaproteobacteria bacterium]
MLRQRNRGNRGMAMLMVVTIVAILTTMAMDFSHEAMINLQLTSTYRDEVKAYFLAHSALNISRLILFYQKQLDSILKGNNIAQIFGGSIQLWRLIPIDSEFTKSFASGDLFTSLGFEELANKEEAVLQGHEGKDNGSERGNFVGTFGDFEGYFKASISDEESKISVRNFDATPSLRNFAMTQLMLMLMPQQYNPIFENRDMDNQYTTREDIIVAIKDYQDIDDKQFDLLTQQDIGPPEDLFYSSLEKPYQPKNAPFDSLEELRMVRGVGDLFFYNFADRLTIYPVRKFNLASLDDRMILSIICMFIKDKMHPVCTDTTFTAQRNLLQRFLEFKQLKMQMNPLYVVSIQDIKEFCAAEGLVLQEAILGVGKMEDLLSMESSFFRVETIGVVGSVKKRITAVVYADKSKSEILYYRED